jgi:hypothetical protein
MEKEFDSFIFIMDGCNDNIELKKPSYRERDVIIKSLKNELAFHEASHLVFACMALKCLNGFIPMQHIISCAENAHEKGFNEARGLAPDLPENSTYSIGNREPKSYIIFYNEDRKRLVAKLLSTIAGYSSYQVFMKFMDKEEYFIGCIENKPLSDNFQSIKYYRKEYALSSGATDFEGILVKFETYYSLDYDKSAEAIVKLIAIVQELMNIPAINHSIRFVKNRLLKSPCTKIEGQHLTLMVKEVKRLTNKIPFESVLEKYVNEIS